MATWMSHIRLAGNLFELIPNLDATQFAIGNIAPDAGVPDEKWKIFDPPPETTHFRKGKSGGVRKIQDLVFFRQFELALRVENTDRRQRSFLLGYFFHLLSDKLFELYLVRLNNPKLPFDVKNPSKDLIKEARREWYGLDFIYVRDHPQAFFWTTFLSAEFSGDYLPFLPAQAIRTRVAYLKELYQRIDERVQGMYAHKYQYLTCSQMDEFVIWATKQLHQIYRGIWLDNVPLDGLDSALDVINA
ncbi:MAG: hypothetical protein WD751_07885 [Anaerolineales bacterium]